MHLQSFIAHGKNWEKLWYETFSDFYNREIRHIILTNYINTKCNKIYKIRIHFYHLTRYLPIRQLANYHTISYTRLHSIPLKPTIEGRTTIFSGIAHPDTGLLTIINQSHFREVRSAIFLRRTTMIIINSRPLPTLCQHNQYTITTCLIKTLRRET